MDVRGCAAQPLRTVPEWRQSFILQFRARNAAMAQFDEVVRSHASVARESKALKAQKESAETQLLLLQHERLNEEAGAATKVVVAQLEERLGLLQCELRAAAQAAEDAAALRPRLAEAERNLGDTARALDALRAVAARDRAAKEALEGAEGVLRRELAEARRQLRQREEEGDALRREKDALVLRLLEDKAAMAAEMNRMNDAVAALRAEVARLQAAGSGPPTKAGGGGADGAQAAATAAAGKAGRGGGGGGGGGGAEPLSSWATLDEVSVPPSKLRHAVRAHHTEVNAVAYSRTAPHLLFTGSSDGSCKVWDAATGRAKATLRAHTRDPADWSRNPAAGSAGSGSAAAGSSAEGGGGGGAVLALDSSADALGCGGSDRCVRLFDLRTERLRLTLTGHANKVHAVRFLSDGGSGGGSGGGGGRLRLVTGSTDRTLKLWDGLSGREVASLKAPSSANALDVALDGVTVLSGHQDGALRLWDLRAASASSAAAAAASSAAAALVSEAPGVHPGGVSSVAFSPRGGLRVLTAGSRDHALALLDARYLLQPRHPHPHPHHPDDGSWGGGGLGGQGQRITHPSLRIGSSWSRAAWSPDGCFCVCGSLNATVLVFDLAEGGGGGEGRRRGGGGSRRGGGGGDADADANLLRQQAAAVDGGGRWGALGSALGNTLGSTLGRTALGSALGHTVGGTLGSTLSGGSQGGGGGSYDAGSSPGVDALRDGFGGGFGGGGGGGRGGSRDDGGGARCHVQLRGGHTAPVVSCAWGPGLGGWQQVASVDKAGVLCLWD